MADSRVIPTQASPDLPTFTLFSDGTEVEGSVGVLGISIVKSVNRIPSATLLIQDGEGSKQDFEISAGDVFVPGKEIEVKGGYSSQEDTIFKGIVIKHCIKSLQGSVSMLEVELKDISVKMTIGRKNKYWEDTTDSDAIEEIMGEYDVEPDVEATEVEHPELVQYFTSDWDFIVSRAEVNGKLVFVDDGKVTITAPDFGQDTELELFYGDNIFEFEAAMDARDQYSAIKSKSWDFTNQEVLESEGADPGITEQGNFTVDDLSKVIDLEEFPLQHSGRVSDQELQAWSDAKFLRSRMSKIKGRVKIQGYHGIKPGMLIDLGGMGDRFNGTAFVSGILHEMTSTTNWYTHIEFGLDQKWFACLYDDINEKPSGALLPAISGLQNGIVTNIHEDPDGEDRIKVRIPIINNEDEGVWARMVSLDAGDSRGVLFRPEVEDEVIVGFVNDDPRDPIILGMVHSSAKPSPIPAEEDNFEKGIITREELKVIFNDDLKSITVETPNGNIITLSDDEGSIVMEDENSNKIEMTSDGITIESSGDINITTSSGDVNVEGMNITNSANSQFKGEGNGGAEISSSGQTAISGSIVAIN